MHTSSDTGGVSHLRTLFLSTIAILACAFAGAVADTAAAQSSRAVTAASASPTARAATRSGANRRRRSHSACKASRVGGKRHKGRKRHPACRSSHKGNFGKSHAASNKTSARNAQADEKSRSATPETVSVSPESGPSIASVLATPCENTELTPEPGNIEAIDTATLCLVNQERARNGELPLQPNAQLEQAAQGHSEEMVEDDYFAHVAPSGLTPAARVEETGYVPNQQVGYTLGENIAWGTVQLSTPAAIVAAWIASPEHLENILYAPYRDTAVGVVPEAPASLAAGASGAVYSQEFGVIVP